jgi:hypothetical protein
MHTFLQYTPFDPFADVYRNNSAHTHICTYMIMHILARLHYQLVYNILEYI